MGCGAPVTPPESTPGLYTILHIFSTIYEIPLIQPLWRKPFGFLLRSGLRSISYIVCRIAQIFNFKPKCEIKI